MILFETTQFDNDNDNDLAEAEEAAILSVLQNVQQEIVDQNLVYGNATGISVLMRLEELCQRLDIQEERKAHNERMGARMVRSPPSNAYTETTSCPSDDLMVVSSPSI